MSGIDLKLWVNKALAMGFTDVEFYSDSAKRIGFAIYKGEIDKYTSSEPSGIAMRGIYKGKMGNAYTEKTDEASLQALLEDCMSNAAITETVDEVLLYTPSEPIEVAQVPLKMADVAQCIEVVKALEAKATTEADVDQLQNQYGNFASTVQIVNSRGLEVCHSSSVGYLYLSPIIKQGEETQNESAMGLFTNPEQLVPETVLEEAMANTRLMFGAETLASGKYDAVMSNRAMASLLEVMANIFSAEAADKGLSAFKDKVGQKVASEIFQLIEDPALPEGIANTPFDSEGVPTQRKALIDKGILTGLLHNLKTAKKYGVQPTGNGFKANFKSPVGIGGTNVFIPKGTLSLDALLSKVSNGLYITSLDGLHAGINAITGDFSLSCRGQQIKSGKLTTAFNHMTVSGNYFDMLQAVHGIADDLVFDAMDASAIYGAPSIGVGRLTFAGK